MQILVIEDDDKLAKSLEQGLETKGYYVTRTRTGEDGFYLASNNPFDIVLLDIMLPGRNGLEILSTLRQSRTRMPVLVLTAKDRISDRVQGLDAGADDYLVKPFAFPELLARIRALLRRGNADDPPVTFRCADLELDSRGHSVRRGSTSISLTAREFEILEYLLRNPAQVVTREMLARDVWKELARHTPIDNVIDVHIARLRRKIDDGFTPKLLHTVRGVGFILRDGASL